MHKLKNVFRQGMNWILIVCIAVMSIVVFMQVIARYVFNHPLSWTEEIARICLIWSTFVGSALAIERGVHFSIDMLTEKISLSSQKMISILLAIISIVYIGVIGVGSVQIMTTIRMSSTPALGIPVKAIYAIVPISALLMIVNVLEVTIAKMKQKEELVVEGEEVAATQTKQEQVEGGC